jgi:hypothetical protein
MSEVWDIWTGTSYHRQGFESCLFFGAQELSAADVKVWLWEKVTDSS